MKKLSILGLFIFALFTFNSCETEDDVVFTTQEPEGFVFTNTTLDSYILSSAIANNLGERFTWGNADLGVQTNITYELQSSVLGDFTDAEAVSSTSGNEIAMTIGQMLNVATAAGLDNDPNTPAPNTGSFSVRLRAFAGDNGASEGFFSDVLVINVELLEGEAGGGGGPMIAPVGVVGSGYNNWGAYADGFFYTTDTPDVFVSYVTLVDGEIKFRLNNDWGTNWGGSGGNLVLDGDNIAVTAGDYKITVDLANLTYNIEEYSWGVVGSAFNNWGETPDGKFYYDYTTNTFKKGIRLLDGEMKVRLNNDWGVNYGDTGADGTLDQDGDNIAVTAGHYLITIDLEAGTITIDNTASVFGVVGSGFNNWGETPDFSLTEIQEGVFYGDLVTLIDGEIKFRANNDWGLNYGDTGADGIIDQDGDNIPSTAGPARVWLDTNTGEYSILQF